MSRGVAANSQVNASLALQPLQVYVLKYDRKPIIWLWLQGQGRINLAICGDTIPPSSANSLGEEGEVDKGIPASTQFYMAGVFPCSPPCLHSSAVFY